MDKNIQVLLSSEVDMEWVTYKYYTIIAFGIDIGHIITYSFTKSRIQDSISEDYAFYMSEDTRVRENMCNLLYENMGNVEVVYIDKLFINEEYRRKGIGSTVLKEIESRNSNSAFVLLASALENIYKFVNDEEYHKELKNRLYKFYTSNGYNHHSSVFYKGIDFTDENWINYEAYCENQ